MDARRSEVSNTMKEGDKEKCYKYGINVNGSWKHKCLRVLALILFVSAIIYTIKIDQYKDESDDIYPHEAVQKNSILDGIIGELDQPYKKRYIRSLNQTFTPDSANAMMFAQRVCCAVVAAVSTEFIVNGELSKQGIPSKTFIYSLITTYLSMVF